MQTLETLPLSEFVKRGYRDFQTGNPWQNCPISYRAWRDGATETKEFDAYWNGYNAAMNDALSPRELAHKGRSFQGAAITVDLTDAR